jgi:purine-nucleoside phosphorylase
VDMWTMPTHRPHAHRINNNRPERNQNCVTRVAGLNCYLCHRLLKAIQAAAGKGILAVEMEAAALYAFAEATSCRVLCLAHVTNTMAQNGADFEKGEDDGAVEALAVLGRLIDALDAA